MKPWLNNQILYQTILLCKETIKKLLSKRNNLAELMFLFKTGLSRLISKLSLISRSNLLFPFAEIVNFSKDG